MDRPFPSGSRVDDLDLSGVHLHGPNLERARLTDGWLVDADISADIRGLRINGVEVAPLVEAELDRRHPERLKQRATNVADLREAWALLVDRWEATTARVLAGPVDLRDRRVSGEWSFVETLRHLIMATDCWLKRGIRLEPHPYHPWGLSPGFGPEFEAAIGLDGAAAPSLDEVLPVRRRQQAEVTALLDHLGDAELLEVRTAPDTPGHPTGDHTVLHCVHVILNEEWEHHRYAERDLARLEDGL